MNTLYITHADCLRHEMGAGHPEQPARLSAVQDALIAQGLMSLMVSLEAPPAEVERLKAVHEPAYVDRILSTPVEEGWVQIDPDTGMNAYTVRAALRAAGANLLAVDEVMAGRAANAFCNIRPPGHHAEPAQAMGFCFFNNIAVAAGHALDNHGLARVAIVDFDVHHGNGTEAIFEADERVMVCSAYQHPFYPFSGRDTVPGHLINVPLAAGTEGEAFRQAISDYWLPELEAFRPELVLISAGFDAHAEDPLAGLALTESDYAWVTEAVMRVADRHAAGRIVSTLEGGYSLPALARSAVAHVRALMRI